jgi:hypothetical protein
MKIGETKKFTLSPEEAMVSMTLQDRIHAREFTLPVRM